MKSNVLSLFIVLLSVSAVFPPVASAGDTLAVLVSPILNCPWAGEDKTICLGECIEIGCEPEAMEDDICLSWRPEEGLSTRYGSNGFIAEVCPTETTTYTVFVTSPDGELIATDEVTVTVIPFQASISSSASWPICNGQPVTLLAAATGGDADSYEWSNGETGNSITVEPAVTTNYSVTITNNATGCEAVAIHRAQVYHSPSIEISASTMEICEQSMMGLTAPNSRPVKSDCGDEFAFLTATYDPSYTYEWSTGETGSLIRAYEVGMYSVTVTTSDGCEIVESININSCVALEVSPAIEVDEANGESTTLLDAGEFYMYEWNTGEESRMIEVDAPGTYEVTVTNEAGCMVTGMAEVEEEPQVFTNYLIFGVWNTSRSVYSFYISHPSLRSNGEPVQIENEAINDFIYNSENIFYRTLSARDRVEFKWVCAAGPSCLAMHTGLNEIIRAQNSEFRFYSVLMNETDPTNPQLLRYYLETSTNSYTKYKSVVEFTGIDATRTLDHYANEYKLSRVQEQGGLPVEEEYPDEITVTSTIILDVFNGTTYEEQALPEDLIPQISSMTIRFYDPAVQEYAISYNGEVAPDEIFAPEFSAINLGILRINEDGTTVPVENLGTEGVDQTSWYPPNVDGSMNTMEYDLILSEFSPDGDNDERITLTINGGIGLRVKIVPTDVPTVPGWHNDENSTVFEPSCDPDLPPVNSFDYVDLAKVTISDYDAEHEDYDLYSTIFDDTELSVTVHLQEELQSVISGGIYWGYSTHQVYDISEPKSLRVRGVITDDNGCPMEGEFVKIISPAEKGDIIDAINDGDSNVDEPYPQVVDRVVSLDEEIGNLIIQWCNLEEGDPQIEAAVEELDRRWGNGEVVYSPTNEEVDALLEFSNEAHIFLNAGAHNDAAMYGQLKVDRGSRFITGRVVSYDTPMMETWYHSCGKEPLDVSSSFYQDLNWFRRQRYTETIAHELGHIKHGIINKREDYKWTKIIEEYSQSAYGPASNNPCFPKRLDPDSSEYCGSTAGHEIFNPDNETSCMSVIQDWEELLRFINQ